MPEDLRCGNCEETIKSNWEVCPTCHANLKKGKYVAKEDDVEKLKNDVKKIKDHLDAEAQKKEEKDNGKEEKRKSIFD